MNRDDLGATTSMDIITERLRLDGRAVMDIGCGDMGFSRQLAATGAHVLAIDPDPVQARANREADATPGLDFIEAGAEQLPVMADSIDGAFFVFSLHHVPASAYPAAFAEVRRVLKPGGFLCVVEPMAGPLDDVVRMFHDERQEQAAAQEALMQLAVPVFTSRVILDYHSIVTYDSFAAFATRYGSRTYNNGYTEADVRRPEVEAAFERLSASRFQSRKQMMLLQGLKPA